MNELKHWNYFKLYLNVLIYKEISYKHLNKKGGIQVFA